MPVQCPVLCYGRCAFPKSYVQLTCPAVTNAANMIAPILIPKTLSMRKPPKKHSTTFGHEYQAYNVMYSDVETFMSLLMISCKAPGLS